MGYWYHPELEEPTLGVLMDYNCQHHNARWKIESTEKEAYICEYFTSYQSDNSGDLDVEDEDTNEIIYQAPSNP